MNTSEKSELQKTEFILRPFHCNLWMFTGKTCISSVSQLRALQELIHDAKASADQIQKEIDTL